jgi:peroxiredoxin
MIKKLVSLFGFLFPAAVYAAESPGLAVGTKAVDFDLANGTSGQISLSGLLAKNPVALVFVRSADWGPFCRSQLQDRQKDL